MKTLLLCLMLLATIQSNGQYTMPIYPNNGYTINWEQTIPMNKVERTVIDRFELLSFKYDTKRVRDIDSSVKTDSYLNPRTSFRVYFEMPGFYFQQRLHSDTLEIINFDAVKYLKVGTKVYSLKP